LRNTSHPSVGRESNLPRRFGRISGLPLPRYALYAPSSRLPCSYKLQLCDDNFEEHVLEYSEEVTGLHLHGLNKNSPAFVTVPSSNGKEGETTVDSFAAEWGFIRTVTLEMNDIDKVKEFTDECAKTGSWNNEAIEGFVVRTHIKMSNRSAFTGQDAPPYPPGANFFFKIKFDEPYMMYRDWREITKSYLSVYDKV
jgi:tRNA ligase